MQPAENFKNYISLFEEKLGYVIIDKVSTETYCKKYLTHLLEHKKYYLAIYADVLHKLISHADIKKENIVLVDYGAGNGLLGVFAKFCGFKKVILNDRDEKFIDASKQLASQLNIDIDDYAIGGIESLQSIEKPDAIVGTDVIEHIYNLDDFFAGLKKINPSIVSVFTTASNPENFFKVRSLQKMQIKDELVGGDPNDHVLFGDNPLEPFLKIREQIVRKNSKGLSETEILALSKATRGSDEADIIKAMEDYHISKKLPAPTTGTNTCNPLNGSWTERILSVDTYISLYKNAGFTCEIYAGFYNEYENGRLFFVKKLLNRLIRTFGKKISPYIVIAGKKS